MARPSKGQKRLVRADTNLPADLAQEITEESRLLGQGEGAQLRRILLEEAWATYKEMGREQFLECRARRLGLQKKTPPKGR